MDPNEQSYERIARWLDGQEVSLDSQELSLAQHIRRQEVTLGGLLNVSVSPAALAAARKALRREMGWSRWRVLRIVVGISAVAAAAVLVVAMLLPEQTPTLPSHVPTAVLFGESDRSPSHVALEALAEQMNQVEARILASLPPRPEEGVVKDLLDKSDRSDEEGFDDLWMDEFDEFSG